MDFKPGLPLQLWVGRHASKIGADIAKAQEFKWDIAGTNILVADNHLFAQGLLGHPDPGRFCQARVSELAAKRYICHDALFQ